MLGWLVAIGVIAAVVVGFAHGQDFSSHKTTPSRAASWVETAAGLIAVLAASRALRIGLIALVVIGALLIGKGAHDLVA